ncbi:MAG: PrgI family protein [Chloroflexota bacterium]|nr:PrgI family protein [Chloroflexota bacterium]
MPKRYEEEINEILHKFDDWPPPPRGRGRSQRRPPRQDDFLGAVGRLFGGFSPNQLMALGLILIVAGAVIHFLRLGLGVALGSYATLVGVLALLAGYILALAGGWRLAPRQRTWRGQVIDLQPRGRGLDYWWWRLTRGFRGQ